MVIAIDGPAGAGKSTVAREVARRLGYRYLDTGAMYRAVALAALDTGTDLDDARSLAGLGGLATRMTDDPRLRTPAVDARVSQVAGHADVRAAMREAQRRFLSEGDTVAEGRDVGAVVWPDSELKVWLDADPVERARRRIDESGDESAAPALHARDQRDAQQTHASARCGHRRLDGSERGRGNRADRRPGTGARRMLRDRVAAHREEFGFWTPDRTWMAFKRTFGPPFRLAFRIRAYGTEHMPPAGPVVLATNHMSAWDPILYGAVLDRPIRWMAKAEVFEASPVLEGFLKHGGVFSVRRGEGDLAAVRTARDVLREGSLLGMFVEGTRQRTEEVGDVKPGTMMIALAEGAPVIPAVVQGTHRLVREPWHPVTFAFGEQLRFEGRPSVREATARLDSELRRLQRFAQSTIAAGPARTCAAAGPGGSDVVGASAVHRARSRSAARRRAFAP